MDIPIQMICVNWDKGPEVSIWDLMQKSYTTTMLICVSILSLRISWLKRVLAYPSPFDLPGMYGVKPSSMETLMSNSWSTSELDDGISALISDMRNELPSDLQELQDLLFPSSAAFCGWANGLWCSVLGCNHFHVWSMTLGLQNQINKSLEFHMPS